MDKKALYQLTYGVFLISTKEDGREKGCIINTCMQVANQPVRIAVSVLNTNETCVSIKKSSIFALSILSQDCTFETIRHFGMQSGREVDKFEGLRMPEDENGIPYLGWQICACISANVTEQIDLGTHTLFLAEVTDAKLLNEQAPLTYADYQNRLKPKPQEVEMNKKIIGWRCKICNYIYEGETLPEDYLCPLCGHGADDFEPIYE